MLPIRTILHPTDYSEYSHNAFEMACWLARHHGARMLVLHVLPPPTLPGEAVVRQQDPEHGAYREELHRVRPSDPSTSVEHHLVEGDPATEILRVAEESRADLIVMGTHGRQGLRRLLMGSVAEKVLRESRCPVLTVKTFPREAEAVAPVPAAAPAT